MGSQRPVYREWRFRPKRVKMEDIRTAINILEKDNYLCSIDLKDAYFLIPIDVESRKYLRFVFDGTLFEFTCLPFGLCTSPYIYSKILRPVITMLRSNGIRVIKSQNECQKIYTMLQNF